MSTMTLTEAAAPAVAVSTAGRRISGLLRAFWYRTRNVAAPVFRVSVGMAQVVAMPVLVLAAPPVAALATAGALVTSRGRRAAGRALNWVGRGMGWVVRAAATVVHRTLSWLGNLVADTVGLVSERAGTKVREANASFTETREIFAGWVRNKVSNTVDRVHDAADTPLVNGLVGATALGIAILIGAFLVAPGAMTATLGTTFITPWIGKRLLTIARGQALSVETALLGATAVGTGAAMVAQQFTTTEVLEDDDEVVIAVTPTAKRAPRAAEPVTVTETVVDKPVHVITDVPLPDPEVGPDPSEEPGTVVPGQTVISPENAEAERRLAEADFAHGPGKRGAAPKPRPPAGK